MQLIKFENVNLKTILLVAAEIIVIAVIVKLIDDIENKRVVYSNQYFVKPLPKKRKDFTKSTKEFTKIRQGFVCDMCKNPPGLWEFHHRNGDRSNNWPSNCEGLCPLCHAKKTRKIH